MGRSASSGPLAYYSLFCVTIGLFAKESMWVTHISPHMHPVLVVLYLCNRIYVTQACENNKASTWSVPLPCKMGVTKEIVESTLTAKLQPTYLNVVDTSGGCGASFAVEIVSAQFDGKKLLERHRIVNSALAEQLKDIHALSLKKTLTPQQWKEQQAQETPVDTS